MTDLLYRDLETYYVACGRPPLNTLILPGADREHGWTRSDWQVWRARRWGKACKLAGLSIVPKPAATATSTRGKEKAPLSQGFLVVPPTGRKSNPVATIVGEAISLR